MSDTVTSVKGEGYYQSVYWNDFKRVLSAISKDLTGDENKWWAQDFRERYAKTPYELGLALNCGNGWVERDLVDKGIVKQVIGFDYSLDLLRIAERDKNGRNIQYFQADVNRLDLPENCFDLVINVAALHHVQYIDRFCRTLCRSLKDGGILLNFDYIGPHRNQYSFQQWYYIDKVNRRLPAQICNALKKPYLRTMLKTDPTEAIHSDLTIPVMARYFDLFERHDTGGGVAYEILLNNTKLLAIPPEILNPYLDEIIRLDKQYTREGKVPAMFSYFLARPNKQALQNTRLMRGYELEENKREIAATRRGGVYSYRDYLYMLLHGFYLDHLRPWLARLRQYSWRVREKLRRMAR